MIYFLYVCAAHTHTRAHIRASHARAQTKCTHVHKIARRHGIFSTISENRMLDRTGLRYLFVTYTPHQVFQITQIEPDCPHRSSSRRTATSPQVRRFRSLAVVIFKSILACVLFDQRQGLEKSTTHTCRLISTTVHQYPTRAFCWVHWM